MSSKIWGGRFSGERSNIMIEINESISFDWQLYKYDVLGSIAHAKMLAKVGIIDESESLKIIKALKEIKIEIEEGVFEFKIELEDIHMNIESRLTEKIGAIAGKLHTARSRNDQVATDFKLYIRDASLDIKQKLTSINAVVLDKAKKNTESYMPGFTHLQIGQPVSIGHYLLAYYEMFKRDISRIDDSLKRLNECPLGACALAGTSYPIDRNFTATELGFDRPTRNSIDSVSDRDFAIEFLSICSMIMVHLSRFAEEVIIGTSRGFGFLKLPDGLTTGSSIMPNKRNPDSAELVRGKAGRVFGSLMSLLTTMKGLPFSYSKDMQEDKEPVFDAYRSLDLCLRITLEMFDSIKLNKERMEEFAGADFSTATDLADWLVREAKIPFREAHHITGRVVKLAEEKKCGLCELNIADFQSIDQRIVKEIYDYLSVENSVKSRKSYGGTSPENVEQIIKEIEKNG